MDDAAEARVPDQPITRDSIAADLARLGVKSGDILYLRCGLSRIGFNPREAEAVMLGAIRDVLGPSGTLIAPAFGPMSFFWQRPLAVSNRDTKPITGAFSKIVLRQPDAVRSDHPTHSFVGFGARAEKILADHRGDRACFEPIRAVVEADGIMGLIGCVKESPGFSTVHLAQYDLGLSQRHYLKLLFAVRQGDENGDVFRPIESPGCSDNFGVFYKDYIEDGNFTCGTVGKAWSIAVRARRAFERELEILRDDPRYPLCERPDCLSCRLTRGYNKREFPSAVAHRLVRMARQRLKSRAK